MKPKVTQICLDPNGDVFLGGPNLQAIFVYDTKATVDDLIRAGLCPKDDLVDIIKEYEQSSHFEVGDSLFLKYFSWGAPFDPIYFRIKSAWGLSFLRAMNLHKYIIRIFESPFTLPEFKLFGAKVFSTFNKYSHDLPCTVSEKVLLLRLAELSSPKEIPDWMHVFKFIAATWGHKKDLYEIFNLTLKKNRKV